MSMMLTASQSAWLTTLAGTPLAEAATAAVRWAGESCWARDGRTMLSVVECLESDLAEGDTNQAAKKAQQYCAILRRAAHKEAAEQREEWAAEKVQREAATAAWQGGILAKWGTEDAAVVGARLGRPETGDGEWSYDLTPLVCICRRNSHNDRWVWESDGGPWRSTERPIDYDGGSGYGMNVAEGD